MYAFIVIAQEVFPVATLAKMVSSTHQVFADTVRLTVYRLGALLAMASSALVFQDLDVVAPIHGLIMVLLCFLLLIRRKSFQEPEIVIT